MGAVRLAKGLSRCGLTWLLRRVLAHRQESAWRDDFHSHKGESKRYEDEQVAALREVARPDAVLACILCFPLTGLDKEMVARLAANEQLRISVMWGEKDKAVPLRPSLQRWQAALAPAAARAQFEVVPDTAHGFFLERPEETNAKIVAFLAAGGGRA